MYSIADVNILNLSEPQEYESVLVKHPSNLHFTHGLQHKTVEEGDPVELICHTSHTSCEVSWLKDNQPLQEHVKTSSKGKVHKIQIPMTTMIDEGEYVAKIANGDVSTRCTLAVKGKRYTNVIPQTKMQQITY